MSVLIRRDGIYIQEQERFAIWVVVPAWCGSYADWVLWVACSVVITSSLHRRHSYQLTASIK
jgi:hypothetical protein